MKAYLDCTEIHWFSDYGVVISDTVFFHVNWSVENISTFLLPHYSNDLFTGFLPLFGVFKKLLFFL